VLARYEGREVKSTGGDFLAEFPSAPRATQGAVEIQRTVHTRNLQTGTAPIRVRIGLHLGDVAERGNDILGDAVTIASRIEPLAAPRGICTSNAVEEQVRNKIPERFERLGPANLKGIDPPIPVFRLVLPWASAPVPTGDSEHPRPVPRPPAECGS
jgi:adenylate cyclase